MRQQPAASGGRDLGRLAITIPRRTRAGDPWKMRIACDCVRHSRTPDLATFELCAPRKAIATADIGARLPLHDSLSPLGGWMIADIDADRAER